MEDERIKEVKNWLEPKFVHDIQVFLGFTNFYQYFIQSFSKIVGLLTSILKTTNLINSSTILQLLINMADDNQIGKNKNSGNKINISNLSASKILPEWVI